jgi:hypothetical protein
MRRIARVGRVVLLSVAALTLLELEHVGIGFCGSNTESTVDSYDDDVVVVGSLIDFEIRKGLLLTTCLFRQST